MDWLRLADDDSGHGGGSIRQVRRGRLFKEIASFGFEQGYDPFCGWRKIAVAAGHEAERPSHGGGIDHQSIKLAAEPKRMKVSRRRKTEQRCVGNQFGQGRDRVGFDLDDRGR